MKSYIKYLRVINAVQQCLAKIIEINKRSKLFFLFLTKYSNYLLLRYMLKNGLIKIFALKITKSLNYAVQNLNIFS